MKIEDNDFIMESSYPDNEYNHNWFFDLYLNKTVKGKLEDRKEFKLEGYGCTTTRCIDLIAHHRANNNEHSYKLESKYLYKKFEDLGVKMVWTINKKCLK